MQTPNSPRRQARSRRTAGRLVRLACRLAILAFPAEFRVRQGRALLQTLTADVRGVPLATSAWRLIADLADALRAGIAERVARRRARNAPSRAMGRAVRPVRERWLGDAQRRPDDGRRFASWLRSVGQDLRYAVRGLRASPGFTAAAVLILFIGLGLNAALFTITNAVLLRPWPVPDPDRVVLAFAQRAPNASGESLGGVSPVEYRFLRDRATTIDLTASREASVYLQAGESVVSLGGRYVSGNYFSAIRMPIALGRSLVADDDRVGQAQMVAVIGHQVWQSAFGADPSIVGRVVQLNKVPFTIVGVAAAGALEAAAAGYPKIWLPLAALPALEDDAFGRRFLESAEDCCIRLAGRLRPGASRTTAQSELSVLHRQFPTADGNQPVGMVVTSTATINQPQARRTVPVVGLAFAGVILVLLLACANVGNLLLARSMGRKRELAIRLSLGAGRGRVVRQLLTESLVLTLVAAGLSFVAAMAVPAIATRITPDAAVMLNLRPDGRLLVFLVALAAVATAVAGVAPALRSTRRLSSGRYDHDGTHLRLRSALLAAQVAICMVLLIAGGLIARGVARAATLDAGFDAGHVFALAIDPKLATDAERRQFSRDLLDAVARGDFKEVGAAALVPLGNSSVHTVVRLVEEPEAADRPTWVHQVTASYFSVLNIRLVAGRIFDDRSSTEVIVNETLARQLSPAGPAVGRMLAGSPGRVVVGVVSDARLENPGEIHPTLFEPVRGVANFLFVRDDGVVVERLRAVMTRINAVATISVQPMSASVQSSLDESTIGAWFTAALGLIALSLAAIGIFGVFSYVVTERTREIGVRMAIGAGAGDIAQLLLRRAAVPLIAGIVGGLVLSLIATPALRGNIYGLSPHDPASYASVTLLIVIAAMAATFLPARRALRVDPAVTLRHE